MNYRRKRKSPQKEDPAALKGLPVAAEPNPTTSPVLLTYLKAPAKAIDPTNGGIALNFILLILKKRKFREIEGEFLSGAQIPH